MRMSVSGLKSCVLAVMIIFIINNLPVDAKCPKFWKAHARHCYLYINKRFSFMSAKVFCNKRGAGLLEISSDTEQSFVTTFVKRNKGDKVWLGITDMEIDGRWVSINTGKPINYSNWRSGQPDNFEYSYRGWYDYGYEECGELGGGDWNDITCGSEREFICEIRKH